MTSGPTMETATLNPKVVESESRSPKVTEAETLNQFREFSHTACSIRHRVPGTEMFARMSGFQL